jgi:hypothetical protein
MSETRHIELKMSLERECDRQTSEQKLDSTGRLAWLLDQLENYVARWRGMRASVTDDLFLMIESGAAAVTQELRRANVPKIEESWQAFLIVLDAARQGRLANSEKLGDALLAVRAEIVT